MKPVLSLTLASLAGVLAWPLAAVAGRGPITAEDRAWWSFQPVTDPLPPEVTDAAWSKSPVDRFILDSLTKAGLGPAMEAPQSTLIRRLYFDLLGLPPSREEVEAFVADTSPDAWEKLVDRCLASPRYGERQARLWLDLVRYAESDGYKADAYRPDAWRYRDYVIDSFNTDKPYTRFISEQLAGDELFPGDSQAQIATGYLRHWIYEYNNRDAVGQWGVILNDITDTTADVFMGLGLQCARCHDHKFDPLLQKDYYRLQAFFAPLLPRDGTPVLPPDALTARREKQAAWEAATADVRRQIDELRAPALEKAKKTAVDLFPPETQALLEMPEDARTPWQKQIAALAWEQVVYEYDQADAKIKGADRQKLVGLRKELAAFDHLKPEPLPTAATVSDVGPQAPEVKIPKRESEGDIAPGVPTLLNPSPSEVHSLPASTGRRTALAEWLTSPSNPLTARVMVNRVWQQHFGQGLCLTASDFGRLGDTPSHPVLLDWLAHRFVADGWSLKKLHRVILTSRAWRQSHVSPCAEKAKMTDPGNRLLWRWNTRRLEAEQIRDALLAATGELDLTAAGGPSVDSGKPRRTIYTKVLRNTRDPLTDVFDAPQNFNSTPGRDTTTTATQSLFLANSRFMSERAEAMAQDLSNHWKTDADRIEAAWWRTAGRAPTTDELEESLAFLTLGSTADPEAPGSREASPLVTESMPQRNGQAVVLTPDSAQERLSAEAPALPSAGDFTVESVVLLKSVQDSGKLRTIAAQWADGEDAPSGWALGITGSKSQRKPRMPVLLLRGEGASANAVAASGNSEALKSPGTPVNSGVSTTSGTPANPGTPTNAGVTTSAEVTPASSSATAVTAAPALVYEPVFSDFQIELDRSYYLAAAVHPASAAGPGSVTFYLKDLANDDLPLMTSTVPHPVAVISPPPGPVWVGSAGDSNDQLWDGLIDDLRLSKGPVPEPDQLLRHPATTAATLAAWNFEPATGTLTDSVSGKPTITIHPAAPPAEDTSTTPLPRAEALADFCQAMLSSSAMLYVE